MSAWDDHLDAVTAEADKAFERLGHKRVGAADVHSTSCCSFWLMFRCAHCRWWWTYTPETGDIGGPDQPSPFCTKDPGNRPMPA